MVVVGTVVDLMGANSNGTVVGVGGDSDLPTNRTCILYFICHMYIGKQGCDRGCRTLFPRRLG